MHFFVSSDLCKLGAPYVLTAKQEQGVWCLLVNENPESSEMTLWSPHIKEVHRSNLLVGLGLCACAEFACSTCSFMGLLQVLSFPSTVWWIGGTELAAGVNDPITSPLFHFCASLLCLFAGGHCCVWLLAGSLFEVESPNWAVPEDSGSSCLGCPPLLHWWV